MYVKSDHVIIVEGPSGLPTARHSIPSLGNRVRAATAYCIAV